MKFFSHKHAFSRNIGLITPEERHILKSKRLAIAGLGGVGGIHLITLVRMGFTKFNLADFDTFDMANFNRQTGSGMDTIGEKKLDCLINLALKINPDLEINAFSSGVNENNMESFLENVDLYVDGLDIFVQDIRKTVYETCYDQKIPVITAGPFGLGAAFICFLPGKTRFSDYFDWNEKDPLTLKVLKFAMGLAPKAAHIKHIVDMNAVDLDNKKVPSSCASCHACSAFIGAEALKILLQRGTIKPAPWTRQLDLYGNRLVHCYNFLGMKNPFNKLKLLYLRHKYKL